jgi:hypothetical protein
LQNVFYDTRKFNVRWKLRGNLGLIENRVLQLGDVKHWMDGSTVWKLKLICHLTHSLQNRKGPKELKHQLLVSATS